MENKSHPSVKDTIIIKPAKPIYWYWQKIVTHNVKANTYKLKTLTLDQLSFMWFERDGPAFFVSIFIWIN